MRTTIDRIGKYELRAILARTPSSTVYDGWDSDIARRVAIKLMPLSMADDGEAGEAFSRFKRGAQAAGQLNHPNIVGIFDYGETTDYAYLVMEFVNGPTLKSLFDENRRFALPEICRIVGSILEALQYSHDRGVVHRDVKPANIMMTMENQVKITDFGIARLEDSEMTQAGMVIGTPAYMSPEQFLGENIDARTDIYSTGVVLYHLLTAERPYEGNLATIMHKVLYGSALAPSRVSKLVTPALDAVVTRAMARKREDRFASATEFNAALQAALSNPFPRQARVRAPDGLKLDNVPHARRTAAKSSSWNTAFLALAALILAAGGAVSWFGFLAPALPPAVDQLRQQEQQAKLLQEQQAKLLQEQQAKLLQEQQAKLLQEQQARLQQEQQARLQREQQEQQARLQQDQQAKLQREQQEQQARLQQEQQARLQQEQARQLARDQARQKQEADQARQKLAQEQRPIQEQARQKPVQEQVRPKQEAEPSPLAVPPNLYPVTSTSGAAGLVCESVTAETAPRFGLDSPQGMVVKGVLVGGRADKAGIMEQDVILKIAGTDVRDLSGLNKIAADNPAGQTVPIDIFRRGAHKLVELQVN